LNQLFLWVAVIVAASSLGAFSLLVWRTRGLRRRLFVTLLAVGLLPAATVGVVTWQETSALGHLAEAPGIHEAVDASVLLARGLLAEYAASLESWARAWPEQAGHELPGPGYGWAEFAADSLVTAEGSAVAHAGSLAGLDGSGRLDAPALVYHCPQTGSSTHLVLVREIEPRLADRIQAAGEGAAGLRQLGLYYEEILRGRALLVAAAVLLFSVLLALLVSAALTNRLVRPLADLVLATRRVADGDREFAVDTRAVDEVHELQGAFNEMTGQLREGELRLRRSERLAAWQGIARRLAHEIKNPLTPIHLAVHRARTRSNDQVVTESLAAIEEETRNLQRLAEEFSTLGRLPAPRRRPVRAAAVAREVAALYLVDPLDFSLQGDATLDADEGQLRQVFSNLFKNAAEAMQGRGELHLTLEASGGMATLCVSDTGPGPGPDPEKLFEPEFTTRSSGTGLGLAIVRRIVEDHGGSISAASADSGGACFTILWPVPSAGDEHD